ncbi:MAG: hypothetical protein ACFFKA_01540 [Candidatus Thorarchaeota archaeon]
MKIYNQVIEKLIGLNSISGLVAVFIALTGYLIGYLLYPAQNYNIGYMGSELGIGPGGIFFNLGIILSGFFFFLFINYLEKVITRDEVNRKWRRSTTNLAKVSVFTYSLLGVFPGLNNNLLIFIIHGILVFVCYTSAFFFILMISIYFYRNSNFLKLQAYIGFFIALEIFIFLFSWSSIVQWIFTLTYFAWIAFIAGFMWIKKI